MGSLWQWAGTQHQQKSLGDLKASVIVVRHFTKPWRLQLTLITVKILPLEHHQTLSKRTWEMTCSYSVQVLPSLSVADATLTHRANWQCTHGLEKHLLKLLTSPWETPISNLTLTPRGRIHAGLSRRDRVCCSCFSPALWNINLEVQSLLWGSTIHIHNGDCQVNKTLSVSHWAPTRSVTIVTIGSIRR